MKRKIILFAIMASMICFYNSCKMENNMESDLKDVPSAEPINLTLKQSEKVNADNRFSFTMFKEVSALSEEPNVFFSPLSLNIALGMLYNGASGDTRTEMAEVLGMSDFTETEINEYYQKFSQALLTIDPLTDINIANSIWYREGMILKQPFIDINQTYFDAVVQMLDFNNPNAADIINQWCADKTKGRILEIIEPPIENDVLMYLINALYFKSKWQFEFDKKQTKQEDFTQTSGQKLKVNMMEQTTALPYYADQFLQCVEMPFGNQAFSMVAILPSDDMNIDQLVDYLDDAKWKNINDNILIQNISLKLPRFKIERRLELKEHVANSGIEKIFIDGTADFSNMIDGSMYVSKITQKTFIEVKEEGAEAAALTVVELIYTSLNSHTSYTEFYANRPFLYLIKEKSTGAILFIGRMDEPKE